MKRIFSMMLALSLALSLSVALAEDTFTSASVTDHYVDDALTGDELMNGLNSFSGFYLLATTNPDGSANVGYFIFGCKELNGNYYLQMGLAENQTLQNLIREKTGVAVYAKAPGNEEGDKPFAVAGARIRFVLVEDEELIKELQGESSRPSLYAEFVEVLPLG